jgi:hypothetical protein
MKRFALLCAAVLLAACEAVYEDVYYDVITVQEDAKPLSSAEELAKIGVDEDYPLDGAYYLAADIELPEEEWMPVGSVEAPFSGIFDGKGRTVRGLQLRDESEYTGLFGYLDGAKIFNFTIEVENNLVVLFSSSAQYAGAAAGYIKASSVKDITVRGTGDGQLYIIKVGNNGFYAGGLAGKIEGSSVSGIKVNLNLKAAGSAALYAGLVAGKIDSSPAASCLVEGSIEAATAGTTLYAGGVAGSAGVGSPLESCVSAVTRVYAESGGNTTFYVGGIAGWNQAAIVSCRVEAGHPVTVQAKSVYTTTGTAPKVYVGGISGYANTKVDVIYRCLVDADIEIIAEAAGFANLYAGGIMGYGRNINNSLVRRGEVLAKAPYTGASSTAGFVVLAGGIIGEMKDGDSANVAKIQNCFSGADVRAESALRSNAALGATSNVTAAGGIAGSVNTYGFIVASGASGAVTAVSSNSEAATQITALAGGIAGVLTYNNVNISVRQSAALNAEVKAESLFTKPYAYRVAGGVFSTPVTPLTILGLDDTKADDAFQDDYALPGMTVQTKQGDSGWTDVDQGPNNTGNLAGSGNLELTQASLEERLGWNFDTDWYWDATANLPFPRYE